MLPPTADAVRAEILRQAEARGTGGSICPSEVARALGDPWRPLLSPVRDGAQVLAEAGLIEILRKGRPIAPDAIKGVIRLRLRSSSPDPVSRA